MKRVNHFGQQRIRDPHPPQKMITQAHISDALPCADDVPLMRSMIERLATCEADVIKDVCHKIDGWSRQARRAGGTEDFKSALLRACTNCVKLQGSLGWHDEDDWGCHKSELLDLNESPGLQASCKHKHCFKASTRRTRLLCLMF